MCPCSSITITESSEFQTHTHTHRHYTLLCILLFRVSETKKNIQYSEHIFFSLYYGPNKGFQHGDDYVNSSILVSKSTVPYVLCMAAEEALLSDARNVVGQVKIRYKKFTLRGP